MVGAHRPTTIADSRLPVAFGVDLMRDPEQSLRVCGDMIQGALEHERRSNSATLSLCCPSVQIRYDDQIDGPAKAPR